MHRQSWVDFLKRVAGVRAFFLHIANGDVAEQIDQGGQNRVRDCYSRRDSRQTKKVGGFLAVDCENLAPAGVYTRTADRHFAHCPLFP